jgi:hypothetical protein
MGMKKLVSDIESEISYAKRQLTKTTKSEERIAQKLEEIYHDIGGQTRIIWNSLLRHEEIYKKRFPAGPLKSVMIKFRDDLKELKKIPDEKLQEYTEKMIETIDILIVQIFSEEGKGINITTAFDFKTAKSVFLHQIIKPTEKIISQIKSDWHRMKEMSSALKGLLNDNEDFMNEIGVIHL